MIIQSAEIPQADLVEEVVKAAEAVKAGATTYQDIARHLGKVERQGRYYRLAAELLGLLDKKQANTSYVTYHGDAVLAAPPEGRRRLLTQSILAMPLFQRVIAFLASDGTTTSAELTDFIKQTTAPVGPSMIPRRVSTIISWLSYAKVIETKGTDIHFLGIPHDQPSLAFVSNEEPLLPRSFELSEYEDIARSVKASEGYLSLAISSAKRERAEASHHALLSLLSKRLRAVGATPRFNRYIDLAAHVDGRDFIFEAKSCTAENMRRQIRTGLSQLYEYQYIQGAVGSYLVLVLESQPSAEHEWMIDYLIDSRGALICWDGDGEFHCPERIRDTLAFLT